MAFGRTNQKFQNVQLLAEAEHRSLFGFTPVLFLKLESFGLRVNLKK